MRKDRVLTTSLDSALIVFLPLILVSCRYVCPPVPEDEEMVHCSRAITRVISKWAYRIFRLVELVVSPLVEYLEVLAIAVRQVLFNEVILDLFRDDLHLHREPLALLRPFLDQVEKNLAFALLPSVAKHFKLLPAALNETQHFGLHVQN